MIYPKLKLDERNIDLLNIILLNMKNITFNENSVKLFENTFINTSQINYQYEFITAIHDLIKYDTKWNVKDYHSDYLSILLDFIQNLLNSHNYKTEQFKSLINLYDILNYELNFLFKYDLSEIDIDYRSVFDKLQNTIIMTVKKYDDLTKSKASSSVDFSKLAVAPILSLYCEKNKYSEPGSKIEIYVNACKYQNNLSKKIIEKLKPLFTDPLLMYNFENNIFSNKV